MTVMSTNTAEFDVHTLVLLAYQTAGIMNEYQTAEGPQWDARATFGRRQLELMIDALAAEGIYERSMETYELEVAAGEVSTALPADTVDIRGDGTLVFEDDTETTIKQLTRQQYANLLIKDETGTPIQFYVSRGAPMYVYLFPVPADACTLRVQRQRLSYDSSSGAATADLERYWTDYLVHELAARVATSNGMPLDRVTLLTAKATQAKLMAKGKSSGQLPNRITMGHKGPYRF